MAGFGCLCGGALGCFAPNLLWAYAEEKFAFAPQKQRQFLCAKKRVGLSFSAMSQLSLLLQSFRREAKTKINTDELFFLEYPNDLDLGVRVKLMPLSLKQKDQFSALSQLPLSQKLKESSSAINKKLSSLEESLVRLTQSSASEPLTLCAQLPAGIKSYGKEGESLYQKVRLVESNMILSQQNKLKGGAVN